MVLMRHGLARAPGSPGRGLFGVVSNFVSNFGIHVTTYKPPLHMLNR